MNNIKMMPLSVPNALAPCGQEHFWSCSGLDFLIYSEVQKSGKTSVRATDFFVNEVAVYNAKMRVSGNIVKLWRYEKPQVRGVAKKKKSGKKERQELTEEEVEYREQKNGRRAKDKLMSIVNSNWGLVKRGNVPNMRSLKFLTLTFKECIGDYCLARERFVRFIDRLEYHLSEKIEYVVVAERQKRGAWHFHVVLYCSFINLSWLKENWNEGRGEGAFDIQALKDLYNVGRYIGKYLGKDFDSDGLTGRHRFSHSRGLKDKSKDFHGICAPEADCIQEVIDLMEPVIAKKSDKKPAIRQSVYSGEYTGDVQFIEMSLTTSDETGFLISALEEGFHILLSGKGRQGYLSLKKKSA